LFCELKKKKRSLQISEKKIHKKKKKVKIGIKPFKNKKDRLKKIYLKSKIQHAN